MYTNKALIFFFLVVYSNQGLNYLKILGGKNSHKNSKCTRESHMYSLCKLCSVKTQVRVTSKLLMKKSSCHLLMSIECFLLSLLDRSPAFLTSDYFIRSYKIVRTKWPIY